MHIILTKMCMPLLAKLFSQFKGEDEILVDRIVKVVLLAYTILIKLKYNYPLPSKFGKDALL